MIPLESHPHRHSASYDAEGNIILPQDSQQQRAAEATERNEPSHGGDGPETMEETLRKTPTTDTSLEAGERFRHLHELLGNIRSRTTECASALVREGANQYRFTPPSLSDAGKALLRGMQRVSSATWTFLTQPVWIVRPRRKPKRYSRLSLFAMDTVRFGGTFALLFVVLFLSLNYQSFWQILSARLNSISPIHIPDTIVQGVELDVREKLLRSPSLATAGLSEEDLLSFLPEVGPPENLLIIPKLDLTIPIVNPPIDALLREDWAQVESDIQKSLQDGVVHYPGTAKPGQAGNFFVTGHSSYYPWASGKYKTVFARLGVLEPGDEYFVFYGGDRHRYIVREKKEVRPSNVDVLDQPINQRLSTLMTCTPVGTTLRRLIISAEEVDPENGKTLEIGEQPIREVPKFKVEMLPI